MQIKVNIQIFAIIAIFIFTKQIEIYAWLMTFALIHELAHMFTGIALRLRPKTLKIEPFGVSITFENTTNREKNNILIALAGPIINIFISILFSFIHINESELIINSNLLLAIANLIPIYPLDGGRILKSVIQIKNTKENAEYIVNRISNILMVIITAISSIIILIYKNIGIFIIIIYLWIILIRENKSYSLKRRISNIINKNT